MLAWAGHGEEAMVMLPPDSHVHSQWSWDAVAGSMEDTCRRALDLGLPSVAFTEHADLTAWTLQSAQDVPADWHSHVTDGLLRPPPLDVEGYQRCLAACRERYPDLRILSGIELGEPHWHTPGVEALLAAGAFERVLASLHSAPTATGDGLTDVSVRYRDQSPDEVVRSYLAETARMIEQFDAFEILAHIDYPIRSWPAHGPPYQPLAFEAEYRHVLRTLAAAGKTLEVNTRVPLHHTVLGWWQDEGGQSITFASDAHTPAALAAGFRDATPLAESAGFRPRPDPHAFWSRG